jgi:hypothetical protein
MPLFKKLTKVEEVDIDIDLAMPMLKVVVATLALGSRPLQRCEPKVSMGITFHAPGSARACEGMNPHTPK